MAKEPDQNLRGLAQAIDLPSFIVNFAQTFPGTEQVVSLDDVFAILDKSTERAEASVRRTLITRTTLALRTQQSHFIASEQPNLLQQTQFVSEFANSLLYRVVASDEMLAMDEWYIGGALWHEAQAVDLIGQYVLRPISPLIGDTSVVWPGRQSDDTWEISDRFVGEIRTRQKNPEDRNEYWQIHDAICVERTSAYSDTDWRRVVRSQLKFIQEFLYDKLSPYNKADNSVTETEAKPWQKAFLERATRLAIFYGEFVKTKDLTTLGKVVKKVYGEKATLMNLLQDILPVSLDLSPEQPTDPDLSSELPAQ